MPKVSFVSGGLFLTRTVFAMLTWLTGHGIWYHLETTYPEQHHSCIIGSFGDGARTMLLQTLQDPQLSSLKVFRLSQQSRVVAANLIWRFCFSYSGPWPKRSGSLWGWNGLRTTNTSHSHVHCATVKRIQRLRDHSVSWRAAFSDVFWGHGESGNDLQSDC